VRLLVEILITAWKLTSVKEHLYLLLLIFTQEKLFGSAREGNLGSRRIFLSWWATKKLLADRYLPTPAPAHTSLCSKQNITNDKICPLVPFWSTRKVYSLQQRHFQIIPEHESLHILSVEHTSHHPDFSNVSSCQQLCLQFSTLHFGEHEQIFEILKYFNLLILVMKKKNQTK
jgi:hypothetical protein